ncbi:uncharacterized protein [Nicotiana tomentosiformis]|uniref:uncharacterized protein n=1 Tax=Nicotiana tomentosiformis TaxID=4098 RepID=UPI00051B0590|nr:uncharacterized protein LOC104121352 [Nicotiana tomentosiformis]
MPKIYLHIYIYIYLHYVYNISTYCLILYQLLCIIFPIIFLDTRHVNDIEIEENVPVHVDLSSQFEGAFDEENAVKEAMPAESPKQEATISIPGEQKNEEKETNMQSLIQEENLIQEGDNCCEEGGEPIDYVNVGDSDNDSRFEKREVTLDDFELPENFSQIVKFGEINEEEITPVHQGRTRQPGKHARSPFLPFYSSGGSTSVGPPIFLIKHPFTGVIGEDVDLNLLEKFNKWLYLGTDTVSKRRKGPYTVKDNQLKTWYDLGVEKVDKNE